MTIRLTTARRTGLAGALAAATLTATLALGAAPASAHTALKSSDPEDGTEVAPPREITLTYTESIRVPRVIITGPDGAKLGAAPPKAVDDTVRQPVNGTLANGTYTVGWRVVSTDGHPVTGTLKFTVKGSTAPAPGSGGGSGAGSSGQAPAANPSAAPTPSAGSVANQEEGSSSGWLWIGLAALIVALAVGGVAWARRPGKE